MQRIEVLYRGIYPESHEFSRYPQEPLIECVYQENSSDKRDTPRYTRRESLPFIPHHINTINARCVMGRLDLITSKSTTAFLAAFSTAWCKESMYVLWFNFYLTAISYLVFYSHFFCFLLWFNHFRFYKTFEEMIHIFVPRLLRREGSGIKISQSLTGYPRASLRKLNAHSFYAESNPISSQEPTSVCPAERETVPQDKGNVVSGDEIVLNHDASLLIQWKSE